jgi:hypothetical protein
MVDYTKLIMNEYFISDSPNRTFILPKFMIYTLRIAENMAERYI